MRQSWGNNVIDFVYDENNQPFAMRYNGTVYYYVLNVQGDVIGLLNANGAIAAKYTYDPWGKVTVQSSNGTANTSSAFIGNINPLRYRGYYYDTETGFYYLQSRYYDPVIGRFINADSFATTDAEGLLSTNMFAYCENNPVMRSDPNGEIFFETLLFGAAMGVFRQFVMDVGSNVVAGRPLDTFSSVGTYAAAALSGMAAAVPGGGAMLAVADILITPIIQESIDVAVYGSYPEYGDVVSNVGKKGTSKAISLWTGEKADKIASTAKKQHGIKKKVGQYAAKAVRAIGKHASSIFSVLKKVLF